MQRPLGGCGTAARAAGPAASGGDARAAEQRLLRRPGAEGAGRRRSQRLGPARFTRGGRQQGRVAAPARWRRLALQQRPGRLRGAVAHQGSRAEGADAVGAVVRRSLPRPGGGEGVSGTHAALSRHAARQRARPRPGDARMDGDHDLPVLAADRRRAGAGRRSSNTGAGSGRCATAPVGRRYPDAARPGHHLEPGAEASVAAGPVGGAAAGGNAAAGRLAGAPAGPAAGAAVLDRSRVAIPARHLQRHPAWRRAVLRQRAQPVAALGGPLGSGLLARVDLAGRGCPLAGRPARAGRLAGRGTGAPGPRQRSGGEPAVRLPALAQSHRAHPGRCGQWGQTAVPEPCAAPGRPGGQPRGLAAQPAAQRAARQRPRALVGRPAAASGTARAAGAGGRCGRGAKLARGGRSQRARAAALPAAAGLSGAGQWGHRKTRGPAHHAPPRRPPRRARRHPRLRAGRDRAPCRRLGQDPPLPGRAAQGPGRPGLLWRGRAHRVGWRRPGLSGPGRHPRRDRRRRRRHQHGGQRQQLPGLLHPDGLRQRRPEGALPQTPGARRHARRVLPDRAACGLRGRRPAHDGRARRRRLRAQRRQAVHHQWPARRRGHRDGRDGQGGRQEGHQRLPRAHGHAGLHGRPGRREAGPAQQRHRPDPVRELPGAGRQPAGRRGPGPEDRAVGPGGRAHRHRLAGRGHGACRVRGRVALQQGPRHLRPAHLRTPGRAVHAGRDGDADRGRAPADLACRQPQGCRQALPEGGRHGQAVRQRDGREGLLPGHPDPRRLRLSERLPGRAHLPRCARLPDLRRHERGAEDPDRPRAGLRPVRGAAKP
mmetsp:Transcript_5031/g.18549  ORF Transcript_5031/g.18549 Transcript_5031/m.18549 type:complete len:823 (-) Transcript_5031:2840-5308(-)